jgi:hypothetical protein
MAVHAAARPRAPINPLSPISRLANAAVARSVVKRILDREASSSLEWRTFAETEVRLALDAAARAPSPSSPFVITSSGAAL